MEPIHRKTTKEMVYEQLKKAILVRELSHKEIFTETMLANSLNTSRTPIREAVADLINEGLMVHIPRKGFKVREITEKEMDQIIFLRTSIEVRGIKILSDIITEEEVRQLYKIIERQEKVIASNDSIKFIELDQLFHRKILQFAGQELLEQFLSELYNMARLMGHTALMKEGRITEVIQEHLDIVKALESKDGELAIKVMENHLLSTVDSVRNFTD
ncbi:GntR family transcriptional regulator [Bacillus sp. VT-16-64]|nr:GntR family transcriptional regulator [Bacillus sp. VT-16-64]